MPTIRYIASALEAFAHPDLAADWDNVGLLLGDPDAHVERIMTCLTVTAAVVEEAIAENVHLIVSHHPVLFRGVKRLTTDSGEGRWLLPLLHHNIAVYSPHTAFDNCPGGINDALAARLNLKNVTPLRPRALRPECKLVVFVPDADLAKVSDALFNAGAGIIGQYEQCSFRLAGTGTFFGTDATNPTIGAKGRREEVNEWRLEVVVPEARLNAVVSALRTAHSYEEPAFDIYPLRTIPRGGEGRVGDCDAIPLAHLARQVKTLLNAAIVQTVGDGTRTIRRVAIACGAAGDFLPDALRAKADAFLVGEVRFHEALTAEAAGLSLIVPGHYASERPAVEDLARKLATDFPGLSVWPSRRERDPLTIISATDVER